MLLTIVASFYFWLDWSGNIHVVAQDRYYRSAQLDAKGFEQAIKAYNIRSIINLRGENAGKPWYDEELMTTRNLGVVHYDFRMSARTELSVSDIERVRNLLREAPKPVLIHCNGGSDRSGLISAIVRLGEGDTPDQAMEQLSFRYGHFPWLGSRTVAMDNSLKGYLTFHEKE